MILDLNVLNGRIGAHPAPHQGGLTQQLAAADQVADGDVEVRVAAAPVGDLGEGVSGQDVLQGMMGREKCFCVCVFVKCFKSSNCYGPTLDLGSMRLTPCLLIAIRRVSG